MPLKNRLIGLLDYIEELVRLPEVSASSVRKYRTLSFYEHDLRGRAGIHHDVSDDEGPIWLKIDRLQRQNPPTPDAALRPWITVSRDPKKSPELASSIIQSIDRTKAEELIASQAIAAADVMKPRGTDTAVVDVRLRLDRSPEIRKAIEEYIEGPWTQWATKEIPRRETIKIYDKFFNVIQSIETAGADNLLEMVFGVGFALWKTDDQTIEHPIIEALVEASIDPASNAICVRARQTDLQVYLRPFSELDIPTVPSLRRRALTYFEKLSNGSATTEKGEILEFSPFYPESFEPLLREAVSLLSSEGSYLPDQRTDENDRVLPDATDVLTLTDSWAIYVRPRSANLFAQDVEQLKIAIETFNEANLPTPCKRIVSKEEASVPDEPILSLSSRLGADANWSDSQLSDTEREIQDDVFFPKKYNDAQVEIIRRLEKEDGVVVQGPPGTGKTHTIANIICHYLATGRSVLVVSKGEPALEVLRDEIPTEIRDLTISLLTSERQGMKQLEGAISFIDTLMMKSDTKRLNQSRIDREKDVLRLQGELQKLDQEITNYATNQLQELPEDLAIDGKRWPADIARIITQQRDRHQWLSDVLRPTVEFTPRFTTEQLDELRAARIRVAEYLTYINAILPKFNDLPTAEDVAKAHNNLCEAATLAAATSDTKIPKTLLGTKDDQSRAKRLKNDLVSIRDLLTKIGKSDWLKNLFKTWAERGLEIEDTRTFIGIAEELNQLAARRTNNLQKPISLPENRFPVDEITAAVNRATQGSRPFPLLSRKNPNVKKCFEQIEIVGRKPSSPEDWRHIKAYLSFLTDIRATIARWNALGPELNLPLVPVDDIKATDRWFVTNQKLLQHVIETANRFRISTAKDVESIFYKEVDLKNLISDVNLIDRVVLSLDTELNRRDLISANRHIDIAIDKLRDCSGELASKLISFLRREVGAVSHGPDQITERWRELLLEVRHSNGLECDLATIRRVSELIETSGAKEWAHKLRTIPAESIDDSLVPADALSSWQFRRVESYLKSIDSRSVLSNLTKKRATTAKELDRAISELVKQRTYLGLCNRMSQSGRQSALRRFLNAIRLSGSGKGVRAQRYRGDAKKAMNDCIDSVPCWIMPTWRVAESIPPRIGVFDLVIIDEASQSDVVALPVLLRAKKMLIVGDDRQVSPSPIGLEERKLLQLRHSYLRDQPFADMLLPGTSLYDLAQTIFVGGRILLNEHFRCVEPIIRFSLQFYPEKIIPLRIPTPSERLDPPLIDVFIRHGRRDINKVNKAEVKAIVDEIERLVNDPAFARCSIGVVSLLGSQQAQVIQKELLERIGEEAFLRHRVACGDSATFQGKERNIVFLSMVASPGKAQAQTSRLFEQRFNVALSRARDRMYLFRSVQEADLPNSNDLKLRVIRHFSAPMPARAEHLRQHFALCESDFERDVFNRLINLGYRVTPQVSAGDYRIDLVIDGDNDRRLAVELDGDKYHTPDKWFDDYRRQKTLERIGWRFWRCWASSYELNPDSCMADLIDVLDDMEISPIGLDDQPRMFTKYVEIDEGNGARSDENAEPEDDSAKATVADKIIIAFDDDPNRHYLFTLSETDSDPANGVVCISSSTGQSLIGCRSEDEVDLEWMGQQRHAIVLDVQKANSPATSDRLNYYDDEVDYMDDGTSSNSIMAKSDSSVASDDPNVIPKSELTLLSPSISTTKQKKPKVVTPSVNDTETKIPLSTVDQVIATEDERHRYRIYHDGLLAAGMTPRALGEWLKGVRDSNRRQP
jgi:very-short-patch-repair endonuclease